MAGKQAKSNTKIAKEQVCSKPSAVKGKTEVKNAEPAQADSTHAKHKDEIAARKSNKNSDPKASETIDCHLKLDGMN